MLPQAVVCEGVKSVSKVLSSTVPAGCTCTHCNPGYALKWGEFQTAVVCHV